MLYFTDGKIRFHNPFSCRFGQKLPIELISGLRIIIQDLQHTSGNILEYNEKAKPDRKICQESSYEDALWEWENNPLYGWCNKNKKPDGSNMIYIRMVLRFIQPLIIRCRSMLKRLLNIFQKRFSLIFTKGQKGFRNPPYSNDLTKKEIDELIMRSVRQSDRYYIMRARGYPKDSIMLAFQHTCKNEGLFMERATGIQP
jgi:penicillin-binding protein 1A